MKKILTIFLALVFIVSAFCLPVGATYANGTSTAYIQVGTTAHDLQAYGLHTFTSFYVTNPPIINGVISDNEYNLGNVPSDVATLGDGLTLTNASATTDYTKEYGDDYRDFTVKSYLAYDDNFAYIAEEVTCSQEISTLNSAMQESTLNVNVRYGLNQSEAVPEALSRLSNSYTYKYLSNGDMEVSSCSSGNRTYKTIADEISQTATLDNDAYSDGTTTWNKAEYKKAENAAVKVDGSYRYVFEYRIPLADVIYSATGRYSKDDVASLLADAFYGSYMFQIAVTRTGGPDGNLQLFLSTGYAANKEVYPYTDVEQKGEATTWAKAAKEYWTNANGESLTVPYIPSPVVHYEKTVQNPADAQAPVSSGFRPGLTGYGLNDVKAAYKTGTVATFTVTPDGADNTAPVAGDVRVVPTKFRVRNGFDTKITGEFTDNFTKGQFKTGDLPIGLNTLVVTFTQQRFDGTKWVNTEISKNVSRNITIAGSVQAASDGASQTGDTLLYAGIAGGVMLIAAAAFAVVILRKKKVK